MALNIAEIFGPTIQGEGRLAGSICYFIRLAGCDQTPPCTWCDTLEYFLESSGTPMDEMEIINKIGKDKVNVVITGGNPCIQNLEDLITSLKYNHKDQIFIETQGTVFPKWINKVDHVVVSPKPPSATSNKKGQSTHTIMDFIKNGYLRDTFYSNVEENTLMGRPSLEFKVVVFTKEDLDYAIRFFDEVDDLIVRVGAYDSRFIFVKEFLEYNIDFAIQLGTDNDNRYPDTKLSADEIIQTLVKELPSRIILKIRVLPQIHRILEVK